MGGASWAASITIGGSDDIVRSVDYADTITINDVTVAGTGFDADRNVTFTLDDSRWTISEDVKAVVSADATGDVSHTFSLAGPGQVDPLTLILTANGTGNKSAKLTINLTFTVNMSDVSVDFYPTNTYTTYQGDELADVDALGFIIMPIGYSAQSASISYLGAAGGNPARWNGLTITADPGTGIIRVSGKAEEAMSMAFTLNLPSAPATIRYWHSPSTFRFSRATSMSYRIPFSLRMKTPIIRLKAVQRWSTLSLPTPTGVRTQTSIIADGILSRLVSVTG